MDNFSHITGLIAAPHTPIDQSGGVCFDTMDRQIAALAAQGLSGVFLNGTTGEGLSLTDPTRRDILAHWKKVASPELPVIAHVGHHSQQAAVELAAHAGKCGAYGTAIMAPSFLKPGNIEDLVAFCEPIAAAAPNIPFYFYHIPSLSGVALSMVSFLETAADRIPNLAGIKFTHGDLMEFQRCQSFENGRFDILWGVDEWLLGALAIGAKGAVGSTYNYAASIYQEMIAAFKRHDLESARACAGRSVKLVELLLEYGVLASGKALMSFHGADCGNPLPPLRPLTPEKKEQLLQAASKLEIF
jgi:N-acetylneuraminate lyase